MIKKMILTQAVIAAAIGGAIGLLIGYAVYGKIAGEYVGFDTLFSTDKNILESAVKSVTGIDTIRSKVLTCSGIGAVIGLVGRILPALKTLK